MSQQGEYLRTRQQQVRNSKIGGGVLTVVVNSALVSFCCLTGFTYLDPPPPEQEEILIEFEREENEPVRQIWNGTAPKVEEPDRTKPIELVKQSEGIAEGTRENLAQESDVDDFGDVETVKPAEKEIDRRSLFRNPNNKSDKDTLAPQTGKISEDVSAGHPKGNTTSGKTTGAPNARLKGRSVNGTLPRPNYSVQKSGKVVVKIWVDNYGNVQKAVAGAEGSTVTDKNLWNAARKAALGAHFNMDAEAPALQEGTITYIFKLD